jgi:small-conductance mechanosensitive channel
MQIEWAEWIRRVFSRETAFTLSVGILVAGVFVSYGVWRWVHAFLGNAGIPDAVEGTPFERTAQGLGTSTVGIIATLAAIFTYIGAVLLALSVSQLFESPAFWPRFTAFLPNIFIAILALIIGVIAGDKAGLVVSERLKSVKLPEAGVIPELVKYSIFYLAAIVALGQLGIATSALLILLGAYAIGIVVFTGLAFKDLLAAGAAGLYLVLNQPYSIGDEVEIEGKRGIVQEVDMFVTHVENDDREFIIPNQRVLRQGVIRIRD